MLTDSLAGMFIVIVAVDLFEFSRCDCCIVRIKVFLKNEGAQGETGFEGIVF